MSLPRPRRRFVISSRSPSETNAVKVRREARAAIQAFDARRQALRQDAELTFDVMAALRAKPRPDSARSLDALLLQIEWADRDIDLPGLSEVSAVKLEQFRSDLLHDLDVSAVKDRLGMAVCELRPQYLDAVVPAEVIEVFRRSDCPLTLYSALGAMDADRAVNGIDDDTVPWTTRPADGFRRAERSLVEATVSRNLGIDLTLDLGL